MEQDARSLSNPDSSVSFLSIFRLRLDSIMHSTCANLGSTSRTFFKEGRCCLGSASDSRSHPVTNIADWTMRRPDAGRAMPGCRSDRGGERSSAAGFTWP